VGDAGSRTGQQVQFLVVEMDAVGVPYVRTGKPAVFHHPQRPAAEGLDAEGGLVGGLRKMRV